jgi:predicted nucleic acid-binding protein
VIVLDASVVVAWFEPTDAHHRMAAAFFDDHLEDLVLHPLTCAEILVGPHRAGVAGAVVHDLPVLGVRTDLPDAEQPVRLAALRAETGLKLPDCCVLDIALVHNVAVATFDDRLAGVARERGLDVLPSR